MVYAKYFLSERKPKISLAESQAVVKRALFEDIGCFDITTRLSIPKDKIITARIIAKESFLLCGITIAGQVFKTVGPGLKFVGKFKDGSQVLKGDVLAVISGNAHSILTAERVALNFISLLSAVTTNTAKFVKIVKPFKTKVVDTRKTIPGLRQLQKYAVRIGGGYNHRMCLDEMILIKDNHLKIMGGYSKFQVPKGYKVEIEAQNLKEFISVLSFKPDIIMLDNMEINDIKKAVKIRDNLRTNCRKCLTLLEASGGIHLGNLKKYAATGVEIISIGQLTDSVASVDVSLDID